MPTNGHHHVISIYYKGFHGAKLSIFLMYPNFVLFKKVFKQEN